MISKKMAKEINAQINREFFSAFLYLAMANDALDKGFNGTYKWMSLQFKEEQEHALKFAKYLEDQGAKVDLVAMPAPNTICGSTTVKLSTPVVKPARMKDTLARITNEALASQRGSTLGRDLPMMGDSSSARIPTGAAVSPARVAVPGGDGGRLSGAERPR